MLSKFRASPGTAPQTLSPMPRDSKKSSLGQAWMAGTGPAMTVGDIQCEISSSASPRVFGPKPPIAITTTSIAALMKPNTPPDP